MTWKDVEVMKCILRGDVISQNFHGGFEENSENS
jgi:hypothetical protein